MVTTKAAKENNFLPPFLGQKAGKQKAWKARKPEESWKADGMLWNNFSTFQPYQI